jgi:membrane dipeptidase
LIIVDAHRDIAYEALDADRDYRRSVAETRALEAAVSHPNRKGLATTGLPDAIEGGIALVGATIFTEPSSYVPWGSDQTHNYSALSYDTPEEAHSAAMKQLEWYRRFVEQVPNAKLVLTKTDLDVVLSTWVEGKDPAKRQQGFVLLMEGADPVIEPSQFGEWYERGIRILGTSWSRTRYAGGTRAPGPLTDIGRELLVEMAKYNAILDLSHMAEEACMESLRTYEGIIIASHANPRQFCDTDRHLTDEAIKLLAERDGVMGLVLLNLFWKTEYQVGDEIPLSRVLDAVDYVCQLTGSAKHVGIGTDWYTGVGSDGVPDELDSVSDLWKIGAGLRERGYSDADVEAVMSGNFLRKLRQGLP